MADEKTNIKWSETTGLLSGGMWAFGIGKGTSYTATIVAWLTANSQTNCAAQVCAGLTSGGFSDWFLPSSSELGLMRDNLKNAGFGNFSSVEYWSSNQWSGNQALAVDFNAATQYTTPNKTYGYHVRPARRF